MNPFEYRVRVSSLKALVLCITIVISQLSNEALAQVKSAIARPVSNAGQASSRKLQHTRQPGTLQRTAQSTDANVVRTATHNITVMEDIEIDDARCDCPQCARRAVTICTSSNCSCGMCARRCGVWVSAEYLHWSLEGMDLPPLATTSPIGTSPANTGVLSRSSTSTLFGGTVGEAFRSGGRITAGMCTDPLRQLSWEASYLGIEKSGQDFSSIGRANPNLARPVFDTMLGAEASMLVAHSAFLSGSMGIDTSTELQSAEIIRRQRLCSTPWYHLDLLLGYKYGSLDEMLRIDQTSTYFAAQGPIAVGTTVALFDSFKTKNRFNGFMVGIERHHGWNCWSIGYTGKLSMGSNRAEVLIDGQTVTRVPTAGSSTFNGGLLAQRSNIGRNRRDEFVVIPEFAFNFRRQINDCVRLQCGYSLMYWSSVTRVSDAIDRLVSQFPPEPISGTASPNFTWNSSGFLAHGFQFGLDYRF